MGQKLETSHFPWMLFLLQISEVATYSRMFLKTRRMNQIKSSQIVLHPQAHMRREAKAQSQLEECTAWNPGKLKLTLTQPVLGFRRFCGEFLWSVLGCCIAGREVVVRSDMATVFHSVSARIGCVHRHPFIGIKSESCRPGQPCG